jgi:hypothetical protein
VLARTCRACLIVSHSIRVRTLQWRSKMQKWEYKLVNGWLTEDQLVDLGMQGWELVTTAVGMGNRNMAFYFKRPLVN